MKRAVLVVSACVLGAVGASAHPHFNKTVTAKLPSGVDLTLTYNTTPSNEMHAQSAKVGEFVTPRRPTLKLSGELKGASVTIPAGEYTLGVIKNSDADWTMALYPGALARGAVAETAKLIKLESMFEKGKGTAEHMLVDVTPGHGKFEGKAVLTLHFGTLFLSGLIPDGGAAAPAR
jgi:hypothetical protein